VEKCNFADGFPHFSVAGAANKKKFRFQKVGTFQLFPNLAKLVPTLNPTRGSLLAAPATEIDGNLFLEHGIPHFSVAGAANKDF
jgi:hypothetical protein